MFKRNKEEEKVCTNGVAVLIPFFFAVVFVYVSHRQYRRI